MLTVIVLDSFRQSFHNTTYAPITPNFPFGSSREIAGDNVKKYMMPTTFLTITAGDADG